MLMMDELLKLIGCVSVLLIIAGSLCHRILDCSIRALFNLGLREGLDNRAFEQYLAEICNRIHVLDIYVIDNI
jgi:hypothetical protein